MRDAISEQALTVSDAERGELRAAVKSVREEWRQKLLVASRLNPSSKLAKKAGVLLLDMNALDDRIEECGGEEGFVFMVCAHVAGGTTLTEYCQHYGLHRGSVWAVLTEREEWYQRYLRALSGVADDYVSQVPGIAMGCSLEEVPLGKFQADTLMKVAASYDKRRFGVEKATASSASVNINFDAGLTMAAAELLARIRPTEARVIEGAAVELPI